MSSGFNPYGRKNAQNPWKNTNVFNNNKQNINRFGNNNKNNNNNNEDKNNIRTQNYFSGKKVDNNNLNPGTEVKLNKKNNPLMASINMNIFPNDDSIINNISNNNGNNFNIIINNRKTLSHKKDNNNNINNMNRNQNNYFNKELNFINIMLDNNKNSNNNNNINNNIIIFPSNTIKKLNIQENNNNQNNKRDDNIGNNQIEINLNQNNNMIKINEQNNNEVNDIHNNKNNDINNNNLIINNKIQDKKGKVNLFKSVISFDDRLNDFNKAKEMKNKKITQEEKLKKKIQIENNKVEIKDILKCYICMDKIKKPRLCKYCNRPACGACLQNWLKSKHSCGFCRKKIGFEETIELPIINDIADFFMKAIDKEDNKKSNNKDDINNLNKSFNSNTQIISKFNLKDDECSKHKKKCEYYCFQCNEKYCDKCLIIFNESSKVHENHTIVPLDQLNENDTANEIMTEFNKLQQTNKNLDDLINLCNQTLNELQIEKNNFIDQIEYIELEKNSDLNYLIYQLSSNLDSIKLKEDEFTNSIATTPIALNNIIKLNDYGQGKQIYEHISNLNNFALKQDDIVDIPLSFINIETFVSDNLQIILPNNKDNRLNINQPIINEELDNLISNVNIKITFEYRSDDVGFKINLKNNIDNKIDLSKILCFIIFKKKNYGIEFLKIKNPIKNNNEIQLFSNISTSVLNSFANDSNKIIYKLYFMVYK